MPQTDDIATQGVECWDRPFVHDHLVPLRVDHVLKVTIVDIVFRCPFQQLGLGNNLYRLVLLLQSEDFVFTVLVQNIQIEETRVLLGIKDLDWRYPPCAFIDFVASYLSERNVHEKHQVDFIGVHVSLDEAKDLKSTHDHIDKGDLIWVLRINRPILIFVTLGLNLPERWIGIRVRKIVHFDTCVSLNNEHFWLVQKKGILYKICKQNFLNFDILKFHLFHFFVIWNRVLFLVQVFCFFFQVFCLFLCHLKVAFSR